MEHLQFPKWVSEAQKLTIIKETKEILNNPPDNISWLPKTAQIARILSTYSELENPNPDDDNELDNWDSYDAAINLVLNGKMDEAFLLLMSAGLTNEDAIFEVMK